MKIHILFLYLFLFTINTGCTIRNNTDKVADPVVVKDSINFGHEVVLKYAKKMIIKNHPEHKEVYILNPLGSDTIASYIFALHNVVLSSETQSKGLVIRVPVRTIVCLSSTQAGALEVLDLREKIIGLNNVTRF